MEYYYYYKDELTSSLSVLTTTLRPGEQQKQQNHTINPTSAYHFCFKRRTSHRKYTNKKCRRKVSKRFAAPKLG